MTDGPENLTLTLLREMRAEMQRGFHEMRRESALIREEMDRRDTENAAILNALVSDVAKVKEAVLEFVIEIGRLKKRVERLEDRPN
jgi:hypothetical protein